MAKKPTTDSQEIHVPELRTSTIKLRIIGTTPLYQNRMAAKAKQNLLTGGGQVTSADKKATLRHTPLDEFRDTLEHVPDGPTAIGLRVVAVKAAMATAAIETAGITKTSAQRLLFMPGELTPLYGVPKLRMDVVRNSGIARTPDIRTRAFLPTWGAEIEMRHIIPHLPVTSVVTLLCNAGILIGVGDFRQEKGKGNFGSFRVITPEQQDDEWDELVANGARAAQLEAIAAPEYADPDTADLMQHFFGETERRRAA